MRDETRADQTETLLPGNLLSFYEQLRVFEDQSDELCPYNLEKPLWVFMGSTVNAVYTENKKPRSDVLTMLGFLYHFLGDRDWPIMTVEAAVGGKIGLTAPDGTDVFAGRFGHPRETGLTPAQLYDDILRRVFHAPAGDLHLAEIKSSVGDPGVKGTNPEDYFGFIDIGDISAFKKLLEEDSGCTTLE